MEQLLSISAIMKKGWDLYIENFQKFATPIIIMIVPYLIYYVALYYGSPALLLLIFLLSIIMLIVNLWIAIVIIEMVNNLYKKQTFDQNKIYESSFRKIPSYLLVAILTGLIVMAGLILLIIPGVIFAIWYSFSTYTNILDGKKGTNALKASKDLVKGRWGATFWRLVIPTLAIYIIVMVVIIALAYMFTGGNFDANSLSQNILVNVLSSVIFVVLTPLFATFSVILFNNLKETKQSQPSDQIQNI
jgi:uncharacterized membrane protein (DUF485 family)